MPNNYFQFKQFIIQQDKSAMKVCTDACLFGALVSERLSNKKRNNILDIGTGTGLLCLMLAQKINAAIDAIEIDIDAYQQAKENIEVSVWKDKITVFHNNILQFTPDKKYDCIISNPPFFEDDLLSPNAEKNKAMHDTSLTLTQLSNAINNNLSADGICYVLLPYQRLNYFEEEMKKYDLFLAETILVKQTTKHSFFRGILAFSRDEKAPSTIELFIKDDEGNYSNDFIHYLKDYYLYL